MGQGVRYSRVGIPQIPETMTEYNPNPLGKNTGDCVIRALSAALDLTWDEAFWEVVEEAYRQKEMPSSNAVWGAVLKHNGFHRSAIPDTCPDCYTVNDFCADHPEGTYVLGTGSHAVAVIDGTFVDSWDSGNEVPVYYWRR